MSSSGAGHSGAIALAQRHDRRAHPHPEWVAALTGASGPEVARALRDIDRHVAEETEIHQRLHDGGRSFYAQIRSPLDLYAIARLARPDAVVETGVSSGISSAHFLMALQDSRRGRLFSIDLPTRQRGPKLGARESPVSLPPGRSTGWAVPDRLRRRWDLRIGPSQTLLPGAATDAGTIGVFLHDSLHTPRHLAFELATIAPRLAPGAVVMADNTTWTGRAFDRFAESLGAPVVRCGRSDLVGLRVPTDGPPATGRRRTGRLRTTR
ncbi:MAG: class I SAM-dependent methyltransferase [Thermoplasmata archaeon]|nr:class I SAM-dependent methyltransferase [Thermoplasmata archaeon]